MHDDHLGISTPPLPAPEPRYIIGPHSTIVTRVAGKVRTSAAARWNVNDKIPYQNGDRIFQVENTLFGGMGVVYIVTDLETGDPFVVKTMRLQFSKHPTLMARFQREAEAWIALQKHPNIVQARGFEYLEGLPHIFLEYVSGGSLRAFLHRAEVTVPQLLQLSVEICRGMRHALNTGITAHRDLKPDNILMTAKNSPKVTDFGLVKLWDDNFAEQGDEFEPLIEPVEQDERLTRPDATGFGTKEYMPPEQWQNAGNADIRSDVYAFGVMLYEMLTGIRPFFGRTPEELRAHHLSYMPIAPSTLRPDVPETVDRIVAKCMSKNPAKRYQDFATLEQELTRILQQDFRKIVPILTRAQLSADEINERGTALFNMGKLPQALSAFENVLAHDGQNTIAWANRGVTLAEMGRLDEALDCFDTALKLDPDNAVVITNKGMTLSETGHTDEAMAHFEKAIELDRQLQPAWHYHSVVLNQVGRYESAYQSAMVARLLDPEDAQSHYQEALALVNMGRASAATQALNRFESIAGTQVSSGLLLRARVAYLEGKLEECCQLCASIQEGTDEYTNALLLGLTSALRLKDYDEIEALLEAIIDRDVAKQALTALDESVSNASKPAVRLLALACETAIRVGDFAAGLGYYEAWLARAPQAPESNQYYPRGTLGMLMAQKPDSAVNCVAQGGLLLHYNYPEYAVKRLRTGLDVASDHTDGWRLLGDAYSQLGEHQWAMQAYARFCRHAPEDVRSWSGYAAAALRLHDYESALAAAQKALALAETPITLFLYGAAVFGDGQVNAAIKAFNQSLAMNDTLGIVWWNKCLCLRKAGKRNEVAECIQKARSCDERFWNESSYEERPFVPYPLAGPITPLER